MCLATCSMLGNIQLHRATEGERGKQVVVVANAGNFMNLSFLK